MGSENRKNVLRHTSKWEGHTAIFSIQNLGLLTYDPVGKQNTWEKQSFGDKYVCEYKKMIKSQIDIFNILTRYIFFDTNNFN